MSTAAATSSVASAAGAGAGTGADTTGSKPTPTSVTKAFKPAFTKEGYEVLLKIERGEALTEEEGKKPLFKEDAEENADTDADEEEVLAERMERNRALAEEARKEADRLMKHLMSLAAEGGTPAGVLEGIRKSYEELKMRETTAAMALAGAYLDKRGFFGYAPNVGRVLDKELGEYAYIARKLLEDE